MKQPFTYLLIFLCVGFTFAQEQPVYIGNQVEQLPVFPGCEEFEDNKPLSASCFSEKFSEAIAENLNTSFMDEIFRSQNLKEIRTKIKFKVSREGKIEDITMIENGNQTLFDQVRIAISKINQNYLIEPAKNGENPMNFNMSLPILYKVPKKVKNK